MSSSKVVPLFESGALRLVANETGPIAAAVAAGWVPGFEYATGPITDADLLLPLLFSDLQLRTRLADAGGVPETGTRTSAELAMALLAAKGFTAFDRLEVSSVSASSGTASGGTSVTITGTGFSLGRAGTAATSVVVVSDTSITCVTPAHSAGAVSVLVSNVHGSHTKSTAFTFT